MTFATLGSSLRIFNLIDGKFTTSDSVNYNNWNSDPSRGISWSGDGQWIVGPIENGKFLIQTQLIQF